MMRYIIAFVVLFLTASTSVAGMVEEMMNPSAKVITSRGHGSATAIKVDGVMGTYLVTNYHVVKQSMDDISVQFYGETEKRVAYVHSVDPQADIAVLVTRYKHKVVAVIGKPPDIFDEVICVGAPLNTPLAPSKGMVTGTNVPLFGTRYVTQMDCNIAPGNSGGGLYAKQNGVWRYVGMPSMVKTIQTVFGGQVPITFLGISVRVEDIHWHLYRHGILAAPVLSRNSPR